MDLVVRRMITAVYAGGLLAAVCAIAPARADDDMLFGQPAPKQFLLNKMLNPKSSQPAQPPGSANGQTAGTGGKTAGAANGQAAGTNGQVAAGEEAEEDDGPGPYPKRYLFNKMFDGSK